MKRTIAVILMLAVLLVALAACTEGDTVTESPETEPAYTAEADTDAGTEVPTPETTDAETTGSEGFDLPMVPV